MTTYTIHQLPSFVTNQGFLIERCDWRLSANQVCWPAWVDMERQVIAAFTVEGITVNRAPPYHETRKYGFLWKKRLGSPGTACSIV